MSDDRNPPLRPLKWYKKLAFGKYRREAGAFLVEGHRAIGQIASLHPGAVLEIIASSQPPPELGDFPVRQVTEGQLRSVSSSKTPQGIIAVVKLPPDTYSGQLPRHPGDRVLLLEDIQDPGNVGTLLRTAAAFGFSGALLTEKCADPFSPKCVQSTAGSVLSLWLRRTGGYLELALALQRRGYVLAATTVAGGDEPSSLRRQEKLVLALGSEASGLSSRLLAMADLGITVPISREKVESLNVAACAAICMYLAST